MILALDIGNTNIVMGGLDDEKVHFECRLSTDRGKTTAEYAVIIKDILNIYNIGAKDITGAIVSSVVPPINSAITGAIELVTGKKPLEVSVYMKHGVRMYTDDPSQLGNDILVSLVAAQKRYEPPFIIFDLGTSTTIAVTDEKAILMGAVIMPGVKISQDALTARTSQLPAISFEAPPKVIGTNTIDAMKSGLVFGNASMIDGMIDRIEKEIGKSATVIATGGLAECITKHCTHKIILNDRLMLEGLKDLYDMNT